MKSWINILNRRIGQVSHAEIEVVSDRLLPVADGDSVLGVLKNIRMRKTITLLAQCCDDYNQATEHSIYLLFGSSMKAEDCRSSFEKEAHLAVQIDVLRGLISLDMKRLFSVPYGHVVSFRRGWVVVSYDRPEEVEESNLSAVEYFSVQFSNLFF